MRYVVTALLSLTAGALVGWYVTRTEQRLEEQEQHLRMLTQYIQQAQGKMFK